MAVAAAVPPRRTDPEKGARRRRLRRSHGRRRRVFQWLALVSQCMPTSSRRASGLYQTFIWISNLCIKKRWTTMHIRKFRSSNIDQSKIFRLNNYFLDFNINSIFQHLKGFIKQFCFRDGTRGKQNYIC